MKQTKKLCDECKLDKFIWKNHEGKKYCIGCWNKLNPSKSIQTFKKVKKISDKRKLEQKEYSIKRKEFLENNPICEANIRYVCTFNSTDVHHMVGRVGDNYLDKTEWLSVCRACHQYIELHPTEAKELGFSKSRLWKK